MMIDVTDVRCLTVNGAGAGVTREGGTGLHGTTPTLNLTRMPQLSRTGLAGLGGHDDQVAADNDQKM